MIRQSVLVHRLLVCERMRGTPLRAVAFSPADEHHHGQPLGTCPR